MSENDPALPTNDGDSFGDPELDRIIEEYLAWARLGDAPSPEEMAAQHPKHAEALLELLPTIALLNKAKDRAQPDGEETPAVLGDFRIVREVGRGGMGVVYEARQISLDRRVALKVLGSQRLMSGNRERFEREAQAVATLEHPNIVPIYSVGEADGLPYMAMKFIEGRTLVDVIAAEKRSHDQWTRESSSSDGTSGSRSSVQSSRSKQIARVARDVARALGAAHDAGVLHRDIKPGNLILDDGGNVWVTDFGLAKIEHGDDLTQSGSMLGTPRYMAPEAIHGWADPRTDVYGVGVSLYEMLTGEPPFSGDSRVELLRNIEEREPARPRKLDARIPRDLETIVTTAMDKVPERRYGSARELAEDLDLFLRGQPIVARPATVVYRLGLFAQRHALAVSAAAVVLVVILAMAVGWSVSLEGERRDALDAKSLAQRNSIRAVDAVDRLLTRIGNDRLMQEPGFSELRRELLEDALGFYLEFLSERSDDPELQESTVRAWLRLARVQDLLGAIGDAESSIREALVLAQQLDGSTLAKSLHAAAHLELGRSLRKAGKYEEAKIETKQASEMMARLPAPTEGAPQPLAVTMLLVEGLLELGRFQMRTAETEAAEVTIDDCLRRTREALDLRPGDSGLERFFLYASYEKGLLLGEANRQEESVQLFRWVRDQHRERAQRPGINAKSEQLAELLSGRQLCGLLLDLDRHEELEIVSAETVRDAREFARRYPAQVVGRAALGNSLRIAGTYERRRGAEDQAVKFLAESVAVLEGCCADAPRVVLYRRDLASSLRALGSMHGDQRRFEEAESCYMRALDHYTALAEDAPGSLKWRVYLFETHSRLASFARRQSERWEEAETHYRKALQQIERTVESGATFVNRRRVARALANLGGILRSRAKLEEASAVLERGRLCCEELLDEFPDDPGVLSELANVQRRLALILADQGDTAAAILRFEEIAEVRGKLVKLRPNNLGLRDRLGDALVNVAIACGELQRWADAATYYGQAAELAHESVLANPDRRKDREQLHKAAVAAARCHAMLDHIDEALTWLERATAESPKDAAPYTEAGIAAAQFARDAGADHDSHGKLVDAAATNLRHAVERGLDASELREREEVAALRENPAFAWLFP